MLLLKLGVSIVIISIFSFIANESRLYKTPYLYKGGLLLVYCIKIIIDNLWLTLMVQLLIYHDGLANKNS